MKPSPAKLEANRRNAQRSTGPRTREGKAASSRNAIRTGLTTMTLTVMPGESEEDLDALQQSIHAEWNPQGDHEDFLVDQMISARWRLERLARWEEEAINKELEAPRWYTKAEARQWDAQSPDTHILPAIARKNSIFDKLERYTRAAERAYSKAVRELQQHRAAQAKTAKQNEATTKQNKNKEAEAWLKSELANLERTRITDPFAGLYHLPEQDEPNDLEPLRPLAPTAPPAFE